MRCSVHGVYEGMRVATNFPPRPPDLAFVTARMKSEMDDLQGSAIPRKRYVKSHSFADSIAESRRTSTRNRTLAQPILWETREC